MTAPAVRTGDKGTKGKDSKGKDSKGKGRGKKDD
jgi:hypothetical protein